MDLNLNTGHPKTMEDKNTRQKTKQANKQPQITAQQKI